MLSTMLTALTAVSPTLATITVSTIPMVMARNCSAMRGTMSINRNRRENMGCSSE